MMKNIQALDRLIENVTSSGQSVEEDWPKIWGKLHSFNGKVLCLQAHLSVKIAAKIATLCGSFSYNSIRSLARRLEDDVMVGSF